MTARGVYYRRAMGQCETLKRQPAVRMCRQQGGLSDDLVIVAMPAYETRLVRLRSKYRNNLDRFTLCCFAAAWLRVNVSDGPFVLFAVHTMPACLPSSTVHSAIGSSILRMGISTGRRATSMAGRSGRASRVRSSDYRNIARGWPSTQREPAIVQLFCSAGT
jgi:hypothetical protein